MKKLLTTKIKIDELGRIKLPLNFIRELNLTEGEPLVIELDEINQQLKIYSDNHIGCKEIQASTKLEFRRIDEMGHIVIPSWFWNKLRINKNDVLNFYCDNDELYLHKKTKP